MLGYVGEVDLAGKPHQQRLAQAPTVGVRDWRSDMSRDDVLAFEGVAGDLLADLGYDLLGPGGRTSAGRLRAVRYRTLAAAYNTAGHALQRSPLWRRRHPPLA
jgi:hypothetical protein